MSNKMTIEKLYETRRVEILKHLNNDLRKVGIIVRWSHGGLEHTQLRAKERNIDFALVLMRLHQLEKHLCEFVFCAFTFGVRSINIKSKECIVVMTRMPDPELRVFTIATVLNPKHHNKYDDHREGDMYIHL